MQSPGKNSIWPARNFNWSKSVVTYLIWVRLIRGFGHCSNGCCSPTRQIVQPHGRYCELEFPLDRAGQSDRSRHHLEHLSALKLDYRIEAAECGRALAMLAISYRDHLGGGFIVYRFFWSSGDSWKAASSPILEISIVRSSRPGLRTIANCPREPKMQPAASFRCVILSSDTTVEIASSLCR